MAGVYDDSSISHSNISSDDLTKSGDSPYHPTAKEKMKMNIKVDPVMTADQSLPRGRDETPESPKQEDSPETGEKEADRSGQTPESDKAKEAEKPTDVEAKTKTDSPKMKKYRRILPESPLRSPVVAMMKKGDREKLVLLEEFYKNNFEIVNKFDSFRKELMYILAINECPGINLDIEYSPQVIAGHISYYINELKSRFLKYQLEIGDLNIKTRHMFSNPEIISKIQKHKENVFKLIEMYEKELEAAREENLHLKDNKLHLETEMDYLQMKILHMERGTMFCGQFDDSFSEDVDKEELMAELKSRSEAAEKLNSSLKEELTESQTKSIYTQKRLEVAMKKLSTVEEESMAELAEISQKNELNATIGKALLAVLKDAKESLSPEDCQHVVQECTRLLQEAITESGSIISEMRAKATLFRNKIVQKENELHELRQKSDEVDQEFTILNESYRLKVEEAKILSNSIRVLSEQVEIAARYNEELRMLFEEKKRNFASPLAGKISDSSRSSGSADQSNTTSKFSDSVFGYSISSPESSIFSPGGFDFSSPIQRNFSPPSTAGITTPYSANVQLTGTPISLSLPTTRSPQRFPTEIPQPSSPAASFKPGASVPRQSATLSPKTPYISKPIFVFTPGEKKRNVSPLFRALPKNPAAVASPKKDPSPVSTLAQGSESVRSQSPYSYPDDHTGRISKYIMNWYHTPPITKSIDRKPHGLFTPRGVFERRQAAVRNLFGDDYESPGSPWGTGRKFHYDLDYEPEMYEDSFTTDTDCSIEWATEADLNQTYIPTFRNTRSSSPPRNASPSSRINRASFTL